MNAPIKSPAALLSSHDELVGAIGERLQALGKQVADSSSLHLSDQSKALESLRRQIDLEMTRLEFAADQAWELAE